jgi:hypothetical protein
MTVYEATSEFPAPANADVILPLSTGSKEKSQMLRFPGETTRKLSLPKVRTLSSHGSNVC